MKLSDFDFTLPRELVAVYPPLERPSARLVLVDRSSGKFSHHVFHELPDFLQAGDVLVLNDTKVFPARLYGKRETGGKVEALLLKENPDGTWEALVRPGGKIKKEAVIDFGENGLCIQARVLDDGRLDSGERTLEFQGGEVREKLKKIGHMPLPPYLGRPAAEIDREVYQTVFAEKEGAVASPTAGLHFDAALLKKLEAKGIEIVYVTLHVGYGTFQSVMDEDFTRHQMVPEEYEVSEQAAASINRALTENRRVIACGTTATRTLEAAYSGPSGIRACRGGKTNLFIYPPYPFKVVSGLITNFHIPKSSLLLLVAAFLAGNEPEQGRDRLMRIYNEAIAQGYHFYSYGDAMVIL